MNKQSIIGFVLIAVILGGFIWYRSAQEKKYQEQLRIEDSVRRANTPVPVVEETLAEPGVTIGLEPAANATGTTGAVQSAQPQTDPLGETLAAARAATPETFTIENDVMSLEFSTLGGVISDAVLRGYNAYGGEALHLWKPGSEKFDLSFFIKNGYHDAQINPRDFNLTSEVEGGVEWAGDEEFKTVSMKLPVDSLAYVEFVYNIPRSDYMLGFEVRFVGMEPLLSSQSNFSIDWANTSLQNEKGFDNENNYTTISYRYPDKKSIEQLGLGRAGSSKKEDETGKVQWVAFKQQFFSSVLVADNNFSGVDMGYSTHQPGEGVIKDFSVRLNVPMERGRDTYGFRIYLGPNKFSQLKEYGIQMERIVPLGGSIIGWISRLFVIPMFDWLGAKGLAIGWIILIMTIIIKIIIFPLTFTSYKSSAKMRVIKPEIDELNTRFPDKEDAMKKQQATMELYKRAGINPMLGCIPMLIQLPILWAMFRFFPASIELRGQRLWWADDLSSYDSILNLGFNIPFYGDHISLFALLMAVSMFFYSWLNFKQQAAAPQMAGMKFVMLYAMPVMLMLWFNNYSAGLSFYYLLSNLFTMAQMYGVRFAIDEKKLRRKMLETPRKPKKKSGFMARLEEAQKAQSEAARKQQQQAQGGKKRK